MDIRFRKSYTAYILRIVVGCIFVFSAIAKYISIDGFDLYVFEHHLFNFNFSSTLTRLLIAIECGLGVCLIANLHTKTSYLCAIVLLVDFTIYLLLQPLFFELSEDDCHCFGKALQLSRWESIGKNVFLIGILFLAAPKNEGSRKEPRWIVPFIGLLALVVFFCTNPPDYLYRKIYKHKEKIDTELYAEALKHTGKQKKFTQGRQLICFFSTTCGHCQQAAKKLSLMARFHGWNENQLRCIFMQTKHAEAEINAFYQENHVLPITYTTFTMDTFLNVINGRMPNILFSENGKIVQSVNYIEMDEEKMDAFLNGK